MSVEDGLNRDFLDILAALDDSQVEFLVVGAHAMALHGVPRATGDLDLLVRPLSGLRLNCHPFEVHEIEFDIDPREVTDSTRLADLIAFMGGLADALGKSVVLTPENMQEI